MDDLNLHEQIQTFRDIVDPEDHAVAGLGQARGRGQTIYDTMMRQVESHPAGEGSKFSGTSVLAEAKGGKKMCGAKMESGPGKRFARCPKCGHKDYEGNEGDKCTKMVAESLEESENRSDSETVFFFKNRQDALRLYSEGMGLGLASGEIVFDPTVDMKHGVGQFAVRFAPHVREGKREILYTLYAMATGADANFDELPRMFNEWLEKYGALMVEMAMPEMIRAGVPPKRMQLDYKGGRGNGKRASDIAKGVRARERALRASKTPIVDTSKAQIPVEGGRYGNKYSNPAPDPYATDSSRRGAYEASDDIFQGLEIENPNKPRSLASMIDSKLEEAKKAKAG